MSNKISWLQTRKNIFLDENPANVRSLSLRITQTCMSNHIGKYNKPASCIIEQLGYRDTVKSLHHWLLIQFISHPKDSSDFGIFIYSLKSREISRVITTPQTMK